VKIIFKGFFDKDVKGATPVYRHVTKRLDDARAKTKPGLNSGDVAFWSCHAGTIAAPLLFCQHNQLDNKQSK
jgi:hypothetical protein